MSSTSSEESQEACVAMGEQGASPRAQTTLFLMMSVDGKITSGETDDLDPDWDWHRIHGVKEGIGQYYRIEQKTDLHSFISAKTMAKLGANDREIPRTPPASPPFLNSIVVDRKPWLTSHGVRSLAYGLKHLYVVTNNPDHPAIGCEIDNVTVIRYADDIDFADLFRRMRQEYGAERITVQSGGTLNAILVRAGLIDRVLIVVAPLLVGGKSTPTLMDGPSFRYVDELSGLKALRLTKCEVLENSYLRLEYDVVAQTTVDPK